MPLEAKWVEGAKLISKTKSDFGLLFIENLESPKEIAETITFYSEDAPSLTVIGNIENQLENIFFDVFNKHTLEEKNNTY